MNIEKGWMENTWGLTNRNSVWLKFLQQCQQHYVKQNPELAWLWALLWDQIKLFFFLWRNTAWGEFCTYALNSLLFFSEDPFSYLGIISLIYFSIYSLFYNINFVLNPISSEMHPFAVWGYSFLFGTSILIEGSNNKGSSMYKGQFIIYASQRHV